MTGTIACISEFTDRHRKSQFDCDGNCRHFGRMLIADYLCRGIFLTTWAACTAAWGLPGLVFGWGVAFVVTAAIADLICAVFIRD